MPTVIATARTSSGATPIQYLVQSNRRRSSGEDRSSQSVRPSRLTAGNRKRAAMAASTKPASPRFRNETTLTSRKPTSSPVHSGSTFTL